MMQHYWQHYAFTQDTTFLRERAFPAIHEVAKFYSDWIIKDPRDGKLISAPSTSPENRYLNADGEPVSLCLGSAMDQQVIAEVFDNYLEASAILGVKDEFTGKVEQQRSQLRPGFVLGSDGRILEWDREYEEREPVTATCHISMAFIPEPQFRKIRPLKFSKQCGLPWITDLPTGALAPDGAGPG